MAVELAFIMSPQETFLVYSNVTSSESLSLTTYTKPLNLTQLKYAIDSGLSLPITL